GQSAVMRGMILRHCAAWNTQYMWKDVQSDERNFCCVNRYILAVTVRSVIHHDTRSTLTLSSGRERDY
ncbi:hypothetical protein JOQ06_021163, partial [Pogonophryne albipinna]